MIYDTDGSLSLVLLVGIEATDPSGRTTDGSTSCGSSASREPGTNIVSDWLISIFVIGTNIKYAIMHISAKIAKGTGRILFAILRHLRNSASTKGHILTILINLRCDEMIIMAPTAAEKKAEPMAAYSSKLCKPTLCSIS